MKKKHKLKNLQITSFTTKIDSKNKATIGGGNASTPLQKYAAKSKTLFDYIFPKPVVSVPNSFGYNPCLPGLHSCVEHFCPPTFLQGCSNN